jgi:hypothetical protein
VVGGNHPPTAQDDATPVPQPPSSVTIDVLGNDLDVDGDSLVVSIAVPPTQGTATVDASTQRIVYAPGPSFSGGDALRYRITDPSGATATALVTITPLSGSVFFQSPVLDAGNIEPGHVSFRLNYLENTTGLDLIGTVALEAVDPAEFPAILAGTPYDPAAAVSDPSVFSGSSSAAFPGGLTTVPFSVACRPNPPLGRVWLARVRLTLTPQAPPGPVFTASYVVVARSAAASEVPVHVVDDVVNTPPDTPIVIHPLVNDDSTAGLPLSVTGLAIAEPFHFDPPFLVGQVQFADGQQGGVPFLGALYTPPPGFQGTTQFYYAASETPGGVINGRYDYARVTVNVGPINHPPVASSFADSLPHGGTRTYPLASLASDADGDPLTVTIVTPPAHGTATVQADQSIRYVASPDFAGPDTFQFSVNDGIVDSNVGTVSVAVTNRAPSLAIPSSLTGAELALLAFTATATDPDPGDLLTFSLVSAPPGAQIDAVTGQFRWTPTEAQGPGTYTFAVRVTDSVSPPLSDERTITIQVAEVNAAPVLTLPALPVHIPSGVPFGFTASASDPDLPANALTFSITGAPAGAAIGAASGAFGWTPTAAQAGATYTFAVVVTDGGTPSLSAQRSVTVTVDAATLALEVSASPDRSGFRALSGATLRRLAYIFMDAPAGTTRVRFWLDDPSRSGPPIRVENLPPFDFAGTAPNGTAQPFDTRGLSNGSHLVTVEVTLPGGRFFETQAVFTVANADHSLLVSQSPNRANPSPLAGETLRGNVYVFVQPDPDATRVRFWLDAPISQPPTHTENTAPFDFAGTATNGNAAPFDTRPLRRGLHVIRATVDYPGGFAVTVSALFFVR